MVHINAPPIRLRLRRAQRPRHSGVRKQWLHRTSAYFRRQRFHQAKIDQWERQDESGRENRGFQKTGLWENYRKLRTNRCVMTFLLLSKSRISLAPWRFSERTPRLLKPLLTASS